MKLNGSYKLDVKKEAVWKALNDPDILKQCIPGCESFDKEGDNIFNATATNQIGPMNATFSGKITLLKIIENESYTLSGEGQSSVGFANGNAKVNLNEENGMTVLNYEVDINVGGKIAQLGSRLINGVAKKMSDYFFGRFADIVAPISNESSENSLTDQLLEEINKTLINENILEIKDWNFADSRLDIVILSVEDSPNVYGVNSKSEFNEIDEFKVVLTCSVDWVDMIKGNSLFTSNINTLMTF